MINADKLKRYKDIAYLLLKHANKSMTQSVGALDEAIIEEDMETSSAQGDPEQFVKDLEALGPTFIKLGQLLSTRPDFLPMPYIEALSRLQDNVEPFQYEEVEKIIQEELGVRISKAFNEFDRNPAAAASLGQVHRAVLRDGKHVAVKVQRPGIRIEILKDLDALEDIMDTAEKVAASARKFSLSGMMKEFRKTLLQELDYRLEAQNLNKIGKNLEQYETIIIPSPVEDYSTSKVLTMEFIKGTKITKLSPLTYLELNGKKLAEDLFKAYLDQVLVDGFFHADPHPGNVLLTEDKRIGLIDLGMVARIDPELREQLIKLLLYISEGRGKEAARVCIDLGPKTEDYNEENLLKEGGDFVARYYDAPLKQIKVGRVIMEITRIAAQNGVRVNPELTMLGKTLLNLDEIGNTLDPDFNPAGTIRKHVSEILEKHIWQSASPQNVFASMLDLKEFVQKLPARLNHLFDSLSGNKFEVKVRAFDDSKLMENMQKIANRITIGIILAALIIGAALMMRVGGGFTIFGYPGIAMILFLIAAVSGFFLILSILFNDEKPHKRKSP